METTVIRQEIQKWQRLHAEAVDRWKAAKAVQWQLLEAGEYKSAEYAAACRAMDQAESDQNHCYAQLKHFGAEVSSFNDQ